MIFYKIGGAKQRFLYEQKWNQIGNDYRYGETWQSGIYESQYPNYGVTWERAHKYNLGLEFGLWNGLLSGNLDLFYEKRNDIPDTVSHSSAMGWSGHGSCQPGKNEEQRLRNRTETCQPHRVRISTTQWD